MSGRDKDNVRYCAVGRIEDRVIIATYLHHATGPSAQKFLAVSQKVLNSDKVLSQQSANVPNAVDDSSCLMQADNDYMYIVFVEKHYPERVAFDMLRQLKKDFAEAHGSEGKTAAENALSKPAKKWMSAVCSKYDDVAAIDKVAGVQAQVDDVKMTMEDNVQQMLRQHEKLEDLEDKADNMRSEASKFKKGAGQLASRMWWQNARMCAIISVVSIVILLIIIFSVCGPCRGESSTPNNGN